MDLIDKARKVFDIEIRELVSLRERLGEAFCCAVEIITDTITNRGKIVVMGVGKSGHIGEKIAATFTSTGTTAVVLNSLNALHGDLGLVADGDTILALSYSGETEELNNVLPALARFQVRIISITGNPESFLARNSAVALNIRVEQEACPLSLAPTSSTTSMLVLGDALAMVVLEKRGFRREDFARYHPGGRLGRSLLLRVEQIMRSGDKLACVSPDTTVQAVLREMTTRKTGAAIVCNADGTLAGIFTHGDFARHFQIKPTLGTDPVSQYMTRNPISVRSDQLAVEVLRVLEDHRIDDLVVLDAGERPVGVVDSQDLTRFKLL